MSFTASIFIPQKPKGFNLTRSEKTLLVFSWGVSTIFITDVIH